MRYTAHLLKSVARPVPQEPVPFEQIMPLKLKATISGKGGRGSEVCCIQEMSIMLACLKKNDFSEQLCPKEIQAFKKCYVTNLETKKVREEKESKGILTPGEKNLSHKQVNILLKKYPNLK